MIVFLLEIIYTGIKIAVQFRSVQISCIIRVRVFFLHKIFLKILNY